ncbi:hypothetical protein [Sorangium atrum]|uniref:Uncharacterized protein n=1 Tax=Sorangium atrum TaxID=2995308 RepID=A0ABT5CEY0_9BACT|nr:hypothetical protein [Sorangium aterium]MDC0684991.1 hypothetical protein [Sorangium aterium]
MTMQGTPRYLLLALLGSSPAALGCAVAADEAPAALGEAAQAVLSGDEPPAPAPAPDPEPDNSSPRPEVISLNGIKANFTRDVRVLDLLFNLKSAPLASASKLISTSVTGEKNKLLRTAMAYMISCALSQGQRLLVKNPQPTAFYQFDGLHGLAPSWSDQRGLTEQEQRWVSACLLAHANKRGNPVRFSLRAPRLTITPEEAMDYTAQEATYFGDLFLREPKTFACIGATSNQAAIEGGRTCHESGEECEFQVLGPCAAHCSRDGDIFGQCGDGGVTYREVVTVYNRSSNDLAPTTPGATGVGVFRAGTFVLDRNRNGWDGDAGISFSVTGNTPVVGDWTGDGHSKPGVFRDADGMWFLDLDGEGWSPRVDRQIQFGLPGDVPVVGDWTGEGQTRVGVFRAGVWYFDLDGDGYDTSDRVLHWGSPGDTPVVGSWDGSGKTRPGVVRVLPDGMMYWFLDMSSDGLDGSYRVLQFGLRGDVPLVGDWTGTGQTRVGVFRNGEFHLDFNGNGYDGELPILLGQAGDIPVVGRWSGTARSLVGAWRPPTGTWLLDMNGNGWDGADRAVQFGLPGDVPLTGSW